MGIALSAPLTFSRGLSEVSGAKIYLKWENLQRTGSFKLRGAVHKMRSLTRDELSRGVTAASTGNHAQGVAYGARLLGIPATVVMPRSANRVKVENTERHGARVILRGETYEEAYSHCMEVTASCGMTYIPAFEDVDVMAGQGTVALEILEHLPETDMILVPVGGGGLISGIAVGAKGINPRIEVIGVQSTHACTMFHCFKMGRMVPVPVLPTLADGLAGGIDEVTLKIVREHVDDIVCADEDRLLETIQWVLSYERQVVEASGVVGVTAIQQGRVPRLEEKNVVVVISGGNIDVSLLDQVVLSDSGDSDGTVDN
ncbi:MAG: pyridoxal-phosphate dependent enzyme [Proteobacteria bacterium]|nr:pyridoxal-phosphate dependent enzyme [Pseudomonadota bacterium]